VLDGFWGDAGESIDAYYEVNDFVRANGANKK
jgi:glucose-1-phosphate thymidylyltransferase